MPENKSNITKVELKDPLTNELFIPKRFNQRFSCRANQIAFNNNKARNIRKQTSYINTPLQKNFKILNEFLSKQNEITVHKQYLLGKGFTFEVYTGAEKYKNDIKFSIYKFIVIPIENDLIKIIKNA